MSYVNSALVYEFDIEHYGYKLRVQKSNKVNNKFILVIIFPDTSFRLHVNKI